MKEHLLSQQKIDPYYYELLVDNSDPAVVAALTAPIKAKFRNKGYKTLVIEEDKAEQTLISCIAIVFKNGQMVIRSERASELDALGFDARKQADLNPTEVSFGAPKVAEGS